MNEEKEQYITEHFWTHLYEAGYITYEALLGYQMRDDWTFQEIAMEIKRIDEERKNDH